MHWTIVIFFFGAAGGDATLLDTGARYTQLRDCMQAVSELETARGDAIDAMAPYSELARMAGRIWKADQSYDQNFVEIWKGALMAHVRSMELEQIAILDEALTKQGVDPNTTPSSPKEVREFSRALAEIPLLSELPFLDFELLDRVVSDIARGANSFRIPYRTSHGEYTCIAKPG